MLHSTTVFITSDWACQFIVHGECIINQWYTLYLDLSSTVKFHCIVFQIHIVKCLTQINKQLLLQGIYCNVHSNVLRFIERFCFVYYLSSCCWETPCRYLFISNILSLRDISIPWNQVRDISIPSYQIRDISIPSYQSGTSRSHLILWMLSQPWHNGPQTGVHPV